MFNFLSAYLAYKIHKKKYFFLISLDNDDINIKINKKYSKKFIPKYFSNDKI